MRRVFYLLSRITDGLNHTSKTFEEYITKVDGNELISSQHKKTPKDALANAVPFIKSLIALQKKYTELLSACFSNHPLFKAALDKAFTEIMNKNTGKWPMTRLLTLFIDHILKGKEKETSSEHEVDVSIQLLCACVRACVRACACVCVCVRLFLCLLLCLARVCVHICIYVCKYTLKQF